MHYDFAIISIPDGSNDVWVELLCKVHNEQSYTVYRHDSFGCKIESNHVWSDLMSNTRGGSSTHRLHGTMFYEIMLQGCYSAVSAEDGDFLSSTNDGVSSRSPIEVEVCIVTVSW